MLSGLDGGCVVAILPGSSLSFFAIVELLKRVSLFPLFWGKKSDYCPVLSLFFSYMPIVIKYLTWPDPKTQNSLPKLARGDASGCRAALPTM
jgi:hypothetical protein